MLEHFLFETRIGNWLLTILEKRAGLAIVSAESLSKERAGIPK